MLSYLVVRLMFFVSRFILHMWVPTEVERVKEEVGLLSVSVMLYQIVELCIELGEFTLNNNLLDVRTRSTGISRSPPLAVSPGHC